MKDDLFYIAHILECIARIEGYCAPGREAFLATELIQDAVLRNLHTLAESSQRISEGTKALCPDVDWKGLSGFRNVLVHDYLGVNVQTVWHIVETDLPPLRRALIELRARLNPSGSEIER